MTFRTRHGHQIPGAPTAQPNHGVARCGGPGICSECNIDVARYWNSKVPNQPFTGYHDVIMVAFDITGSSAEYAHNKLMGEMPDPDDFDWMDSWWVANDERFDGSDQDSAIFVSKGLQKEARALLRQSGLVH